MKKVLVVGAAAHAGMIGKAVTEVLDKHGHDIVVVSPKELKDKSIKELNELAEDIKSMHDFEPLILDSLPSFEDYKYSAKEKNPGHRRPYKYHR